jgi:hypothetical protein
MLNAQVEIISLIIVKNQFYLRVIFIAIFDVEINSGYLKKTDYFLTGCPKSPKNENF